MNIHPTAIIEEDVQLGANCVGWYESEIDSWIVDPR